MYNSLLFEVKEGVGYITLNRPDSYNSFNEELSAELIDALKKSAKDDAVKVVVISGAGKAFCSGQDLKDVKNGDQKRSLGDSVVRRYNPMIINVREHPKPVICRLNGVAAGAGASLAMACDIIVAAENIQFVEAFANIGLVADSGGSFFLPQSIPYNKAFEIEFAKYDWLLQPLLYDNPKLIGDFAKNDVFVEIQFGNSATLYRDYYKFHYGLIPEN